MIRGIAITRGVRETAQVMARGGENVSSKYRTLFVVITNVLNFTLRPYKKIHGFDQFYRTKIFTLANLSANTVFKNICRLVDPT